MNRAITDGALTPSLLTQRDIVQDTWPAEDVATAGDLSCSRWVEAYWTGGYFMAADSLEKHNRI